MRLGRYHRILRDRARRLRRLERLVESGKDKLEVVIGNCHIKVGGFDHDNQAPKVRLAWTGYDVTFYGNNIGRLRDFLNKHFPPTESKT